MSGVIGAVRVLVQVVPIPGLVTGGILAVIGVGALVSAVADLVLMAWRAFAGVFDREGR